MNIKLQHQSAGQPLKTLDLSGSFKRGLQVKGPSARKKTLDDSKKGICAFLFCTMVSEAIPILLMSWIPDLSGFHFNIERGKYWGWILFFVPGT